MDSKIERLLAVPEVPPREGDGRRDNGPRRMQANAHGAVMSLRRRRTLAKRKRQESER